ncbi:apicomplexan specific region near n-terminus [Plasmopara halstedii]|uniref:Apicomplexan specific region near n-terminus n=1 Tax=Plasmopara halstedii TaxID=4781 RepID=A0A0P1AXM8_PLAHL|nr:apicomplexan specific region near n-terminus [Plasmopara halstedii]CEG46200.1 apicomplexan specific region near n-terminus [Plasmopara halstedii]|eukprot:XP_024582569.1 apicomplexan specific region near n-terminus [Plasmopara halstedii]
MEGMLNYFVPEDGDTSDHLNVVPLPRVEQLRLLHVKKSFPLPGDFHFRFKTAFEGTYVWLDVVNDADPVPDFNGLVISKISRVQRESLIRKPERTETSEAQREATDLIETSEAPSSPTKREDPKPVQKAFNNDLVGLMTDPVPSSLPQTPSAPSPTPPNTNSAPPQTARDPFDVFAGNHATPMRPAPISANMAATSVPRGLSPTTMGNHGGAYGGQVGFNPMGSGSPSPMAPRGPSGMNISQMHMGIWQGMGQQPQQRNPNQSTHTECTQ